MTTPTIAVLEGDQTGQDLLAEALRVLDKSVIDLELAFEPFDLSLENRRSTNNQVVLDAANAVKPHGLGLKAATITPEQKGDVGSPNAILRRAIEGKVIVRTGRKLPRVRPVAGIHAPISVVRMAVGDAYGAKEWRAIEDGDEIASTEVISRNVCRYVAEFAFVQAAKIGGRGFGRPKYTVSPVYEGMLKEEMDAAAERHRDVPYDPQLIDATYALLLSNAGDDPLVIPFAQSRRRLSLGHGHATIRLDRRRRIDSTGLSGNDAKDFTPSAVMAEAPHGTAPRLFGKNVANPLAMILAAGAVLGYVNDRRAKNALCRARSTKPRSKRCTRPPPPPTWAGHVHDRIHRRSHRRRQAQTRRLVHALTYEAISATPASASATPTFCGVAAFFENDPREEDGARRIERREHDGDGEVAGVDRQDVQHVGEHVDRAGQSDEPNHVVRRPEGAPVASPSAASKPIAPTRAAPSGLMPALLWRSAEKQQEPADDDAGGDRFLHARRRDFALARLFARIRDQHHRDERNGETHALPQRGPLAAREAHDDGITTAPFCGE